jgi:hypothetical protein
MPIPTPEDDRIAKIVEAGATALAERDGVACFRPLHDTADDQHIRDSCRQEARLVIEATRAAIEAPLRKQLDAVEDQLLSSVENGPWVLIADPGLRRLVGEYVADTCHSVASAAGLDEAMERAHDAMPQRLARSLPTALPDSGAPRRDLAADDGSEDARPAVADLPSGSIVVDDLKGVAYYAAGEPGEAYRWYETMYETTDSTVDYALRHGAEVVRVGDGGGRAAVLQPAGPDSRERLARHLYLTESRDEHGEAHWDGGEVIAYVRDRYLRNADTILALIASKGGPTRG